MVRAVGLVLLLAGCQSEEEREWQRQYGYHLGRLKHLSEDMAALEDSADLSIFSCTDTTFKFTPCERMRELRKEYAASDTALLRLERHGPRTP
jgi:hypothetical protein